MPTNVSFSPPVTPGPVGQVDVRGPRFAAWVTTAVLVATLIAAGLSLPAAAAVLAAQTTVFAIGVIGGPRRHPYGRIFATLIAQRLSPPDEFEPTAPLTFAQLVGLAFGLVGVVGFLTSPPIGLAATALALGAAFLNAAFGICLGCRLYPIVHRVRQSSILPR